MAEDTSWMSDPTTYADPYKQMGTAYTTEDRMAALERYRKWLEQQYKIQNPTTTTPGAVRYTKSGGSSGLEATQAEWDAALAAAGGETSPGHIRGSKDIFGGTYRPDMWRSQGASVTTDPSKALIAGMPTSQNLYDQYFNQYKAQKPQMGGRGSGRKDAYISWLRGSVYAFLIIPVFSFLIKFLC